MRSTTNTVLLLTTALALGGCRSESPGSTTVTETSLILEASLTLVSAGLPDGGDAARPDDAVDAGTTADGSTIGARVATLEITARDGVTPVVTDLWLYTLEGAAQTPLTAFTSTAPRKSPGLMLPATIAGRPSGLSPADDGRANGLMTNASRGSLSQGAFVSAVDGRVVVTLAMPPTAPILIVAGVEDQRYGGATVVNPDGTPGTVPDGVGAPETHVHRSFSHDVVPLLAANCARCHEVGGPDDADFYLVTGTRDQLVNDNYALKEQTADCQADNPDGGDALAACLQGITKAQFLVEPGAPAASDLLQRSRPDEAAGSSPQGLAWFGGGKPKTRFNASYGDRRMPSTTTSTNPAAWHDVATWFDDNPSKFQVIFDWVAQGALDD